MKYKVTGNFDMTINVLDGSTPPSDASGSVEATISAVVASLQGTFTDPVIPPPSSVDGDIDREFSDMTASLAGNYTSPPSSGTTHLVPNGTTMAAVNNLNVSFGDTVAFEAGATFIVNTYANRLQCKSGITYTRYGSGNNPIIDGDTAWNTYPAKQRGLIEVANVNNVTVDGLNATGTRLTCFTLGILSSQNILIQNCKVYDSLGSGIMMNSWHANSDTTRDVVVQYCEVTGMGGDASESFVVMGGSDNIVGRYNWGHDNKKAAWNTKGGSTNVEVHHCLFEATNVDPMLYTERADNVEYHHNFLTRSDPTSSLSKPFLSIGLEPLGGMSDRHNRNIHYHHNTIYDCDDVGVKFSIKIGAFDGGTAPSQPMLNHTIEHNTIHTTSQRVGDPNDHIVNYTDNTTESPGTDYWTNIIFRNNIMWNPDGGAGQKSVRVNDMTIDTIRNNLLETGKANDATHASNVTTSTDPINDAANYDFTLAPGSAAEGAAHDGSDIGSGLSRSDVTGFMSFWPAGIQ